MDDDEKVMGPG